MSAKLTPEDIKSIEENFVLAHNDEPDDSGMVHRAFGHEWKLKALCKELREAQKAWTYPGCDADRTILSLQEKLEAVDAGGAPSPYRGSR